MKIASIYTSNGAMVYQYGSSRTVCPKGEQRRFQVLKNGIWEYGRNSYAAVTIEKVKSALGKV